MFLKLLQKKQELAAYAWRTRQPPHASAPAPKGFEDLSPGQFAEREAGMATSNALYQKAWDDYLARTGQSEEDVRAALSKPSTSP
jgi:hypothetical protein